MTSFPRSSGAYERAEPPYVTGLEEAEPTHECEWVSQCCGAGIISDTDICAACQEHTGEECLACIEEEEERVVDAQREQARREEAGRL